MDEVVEKHRSNGGHADKAGVGEIEGEGEESLVKGGEGEGDVVCRIVGVEFCAILGKVTMV